MLDQKKVVDKCRYCKKTLHIVDDFIVDHLRPPNYYHLSCMKRYINKHGGLHHSRK
jgi:hypothetical protein